MTADLVYFTKPKHKIKKKKAQFLILACASPLAYLISSIPRKRNFLSLSERIYSLVYAKISLFLYFSEKLNSPNEKKYLSSF